MPDAFASLTSRWRRLAVKALLFALPLVLVLVGLDRYLAQTVVTEDELKYQVLFSDSAPRDLLLGTSCFQFGVDPTLVSAGGATFYNFAFRGANPAFHRAWYEVYRARHGAPRRVVLEADWVLVKPVLGRRLENDSEYMPTPLFAEWLARPGTVRGMLLLGRLPLIKYREDLKARLFASPVDDARLGERYVRGHLRPRVSGHDPKPPGKNYDAPDDPAAVATLDALLRRMRADGVAVALVQPPHYLPTSGARARERAAIAAIARACGVVYLDYNGALGGPLNRDASAFMDWAHLNRAGSQVFSRRLQADLKRHRFL